MKCLRRYIESRITTIKMLVTLESAALRMDTRSMRVKLIKSSIKMRLANMRDVKKPMHAKDN